MIWAKGVISCDLDVLAVQMTVPCYALQYVPRHWGGVEGGGVDGGWWHTMEQGNEQESLR